MCLANVAPELFLDVFQNFISSTANSQCPHETILAWMSKICMKFLDFPLVSFCETSGKPLRHPLHHLHPLLLLLSTLQALRHLPIHHHASMTSWSRASSKSTAKTRDPFACTSSRKPLTMASHSPGGYVCAFFAIPFMRGECSWSP